MQSGTVYNETWLKTDGGSMTNVYNYTIPALLFTALPVTALAELDYARDIRPILSENCYACHGPDENTREADLRLDDVADAIDWGAISPGDVADSLIIEKITAEKNSERMPPEDSKKFLSTEQIQLLKEWVEAGAPSESHWAFEIPVRPEVPKSSNWVRDPIDAFVLRKISEAGFEPAQEVDPVLWLRRVTFDLTGLPPTLEEITAFESNTSDDRYERTVDRLLTSDAYGEHMARGWLDVARFADTFGYQSDVETHLWPWRDWVIQSFNDNMPYDQFLTEQLAGDLLPNPTQDQIIATAFNRLHRQTNEGGSVNEEFRIEYNADRVQVMGTAFMGITFECARCHDHKFDPLPMKSYYEMMDFFDDIDESGLYSHFTNATPTPALTLYTPESKAKHEDLLAAINAAAEELKTSTAAPRRSYDRWLERNGRAVPDLEPEIHLSFNGETGLENDGSKGTAEGQFIREDYSANTVNKFTGESAIRIKDAGIWNRYDPFSLALWVRVEEMLPHMIVVHKTKAPSDAGSRGYELMIDDGQLTFGLVHFWPGDALRVQANDVLPVGEWVHLTATYDGSSKASGIQLYIDGRAADHTILRDKLTRTIWYNANGNDPPLELGARFRDNGFRNGQIDDFMAFDRKLTSIEVEAIVRAEPTSVIVREAVYEQRIDEVRDFYLSRVDRTSISDRAKLRDARQAEAKHLDSIRQLMVMLEEPDLHPTRILDRGHYANPTTEVLASFPSTLVDIESEFRKDRLGLTLWLLHPDHPLTARVAANRLWQQIFGRGLVETQEDFGLQGDLPTHPELLDYLAIEYREIGWDTKAMLKRFVLSSTYRQSSKASSEILEADPENYLLARATPYRRTAEEIRDAALAGSGLMTRAIGGPSVKPYQPEGLWKDASSATYKADTGDNLYRRSLYTFIKRTVPPPSMLTFDATTREECVTRRERTITPLQALILLNDPQYVEAARVLAEKTVVKHKDNAAAAVTEMFRALLTRTPSEREVDILTQTLAEQHDWFKAHEEDAKNYLGVGEKERLIGLDHAQVAAHTAVAQAIMNLNEFQVKL